LNLATEDIYNEVPVLTVTGEIEPMIRMNRLLRNRLALSTVITTLIILVVSILLASVLVYFAVNVVSTRVQQESLSVTNAHVWVNSAGDAEGAIMISNLGGRDVVIKQVEVRGIPIPWGNMLSLYAVTTGQTPDAGLTQSLPYLTSPIATDTPVEIGNTQVFANNLVLATSQLILPSGDVMVLYINSPNSVTINDIGTTIGLTVFTAQAMYYTETNVQAAPPAA
jgi:hypothetical protein